MIQLSLRFHSWPDRWELGPCYESTSERSWYVGERCIDLSWPWLPWNRR